MRRIKARFVSSSQPKPVQAPDVIQETAAQVTTPTNRALRVAEALARQASVQEHDASPQLLQQIHLSNSISLFLRNRSPLNSAKASAALKDYLLANGAEIGAVSPSAAIEFTRLLLAGVDVGLNVIEELEVMGPQAAIPLATRMLQDFGAESYPLDPAVGNWAAQICSSYIPPMPGPSNTGTM